MRCAVLLLLLAAPAAAQEKLIAPEKVPVYSLVTVTAQKKAKHYDVLVQTVQGDRIAFVKVQATDQPGQWVFTGPPGVYALRITSFDPEKGFSSEVGETTIGTPKPPPGPGPGPGPGPDPDPGTIPADEFGNLGRDVHKWMAEYASPNFPRKEVATIWRTAAARLAGDQEPLIPTITKAFDFIKEAHGKLTEQTKQEWGGVKAGINKRWNEHRASMERTSTADFFRAVANGVDPPKAPAGDVVRKDTNPVGSDKSDKTDTERTRPKWRDLTPAQRARWMAGGAKP